MFTLAFLNNINGAFIVVVGILGLLLFGKDVPNLARKLVKGYFRIRYKLRLAADRFGKK